MNSISIIVHCHHCQRLFFACSLLLSLSRTSSLLASWFLSSLWRTGLLLHFLFVLYFLQGAVGNILFFLWLFFNFLAFALFHLFLFLHFSLSVALCPLLFFQFVGFCSCFGLLFSLNSSLFLSLCLFLPLLFAFYFLLFPFFLAGLLLFLFGFFPLLFESLSLFSGLLDFLFSSPTTLLFLFVLCGCALLASLVIVILWRLFWFILAHQFYFGFRVCPNLRWASFAQPCLKSLDFSQTIKQFFVVGCLLKEVGGVNFDFFFSFWSNSFCDFLVLSLAPASMRLHK